MKRIHPRIWDIAYALLLAIAIPVAVFHSAQERWPQAILVTIAAIVGAFLLITGWNRTDETVPAAPARTPPDRDTRPSQSNKIELDHERDPNGRYRGWIQIGAVSGFVATDIMTAAVLLGYGMAALLGSATSGANQIQIWLAALVDNTVTEIATVNLAAAIAVHLVAGVVWAIVYAGYVEPRISGTELQRGLKFGLIPWILSIVVFFPLVGAGFFAVDVGAGPLPVLGNLILHLIYGAALGKVYASHAVWKEPVSEVTSDNIEVLELAQRGMAIGLIPGAIVGMALSVVATSVFTAETDLVMAGVLGAVVGSAVGVWIGSLAGLSPGMIRNGENA